MNAFDVKNLKTEREIQDFAVKNKVYFAESIKEIKENWRLYQKYVGKVEELYPDLFEPRRSVYTVDYEFGGRKLTFKYMIEFSERDWRFALYIQHPANREDEEAIEAHKEVIERDKNRYTDIAIEKNAKIWGKVIPMMRQDPEYVYVEKRKNRKPREGKPVIWELRYQPTVFNLATSKQVGGNYPVGGELIAEVDDELLDLLEEYYPGADIRIGDRIRMNNGWTLD